jgi:hypothetical protein
MIKDRELEEKEKLVNEELDTLAQELADAELNHRTEIDGLKLDLKAMQLYLSQIHPEFDEQFTSLREKVRLEFSPE